MDRHNQAICEAIWTNISKYAQKTAVVLPHGKQTYGELGEDAERIAQVLSEELENSTSLHCVGVFMGRDRYLIPSVLSLLRLGLTYVPLTPQLPINRIEYIARDCGMPMIITTSDLVDKLPQGIKCVCVDKLLSNLQSQISKLKSQNSNLKTQNSKLRLPAYIIYTSGTTGNPKGVVIPFKSMHAFLSVLDRPELTNFSPDSRVLLFASITFDASIIEIFGTLYYGGTIIMASEEERTDAKLLYKLMTKQRVTFCLLSPSLMSVFPSFDFPDMEALFVGGEAMVPVVYQRALGHQYRFVNVYGPTENTVYSTMRVVTPDISPQNIGHTFPYVTGYVLDDNLRPVQVGEVGELMLGGDQLASGYLNLPELTAMSFIHISVERDALPAGTPSSTVVYRTGDLVRLMPDGSYDYVGRKDFQVNLHGFRVELYEVKRRIEQCAGVAKVFVRIEDIGSDKQQVAYVQTDGTVTRQAIQDELRKFLPDYMVPRYYVFLKEFPRNINGKVDATRLDRQFSSLKKEHELLTPEEEIVKSVVSRIMSVDDIDIDTDLVDELGLTSLQIMQASQSLDFTGFYTSAKDFITNRTIRKIAANHKPQPCYWYNQPRNDRKTLVVVSGYTSFVFLYTKWAKNIEDAYNIFVIESYHDTSESKILDYETIIERYYGYLMEHFNVAGTSSDTIGIDILTGFCLGGEMALYLAQKLDERLGLHPHVVVMDGEVDRDADYRDNTPIFNFPDFTPEINEKRYEQDMTLVETTPDFHYAGTVTSILSAKYNTEYSDVFKDNRITQQMREAAYGYFKRAGQYWKNRYPDCELLYIDTDHDHYLLDDVSISYLTDYFHKLAGTDS